MGRKSSIHIKPRSIIKAVLHNARVFDLDYAIRDKSENENKILKSEEYLKSLLSKIKLDYQKHSYRGRKLPKNSTPIREGAVNLEAHHTMENLKDMSEKIAKKMGVEILSLSIHNDEGHINSEGEEVINHHAHILFNYYNFDTHKIVHHQSNLMSQIQTMVAEELGMERGISKKITKAKHIPHGQYRVIAAEKEKAVNQALVPAIKNVTQLKKEITKLSQELRSTNKKLSEADKIYTKEDYQALNKLKRELNQSNFSEVVKDFYTLYENFNKLKEELVEKEKEISELEELAYAKVADDYDFEKNKVITKKVSYQKLFEKSESENQLLKFSHDELFEKTRDYDELNKIAYRRFDEMDYPDEICPDKISYQDAYAELKDINSDLKNELEVSKEKIMTLDKLHEETKLALAHFEELVEKLAAKGIDIHKLAEDKPKPPPKPKPSGGISP